METKSAGDTLGGSVQDLPGFFKKWWVASRPFSFPASVMSVLFGSAAAVTAGGTQLKAPLLLAAALGMALLHAASNILNDAEDFNRGLDKQVLPVSGAVVRKWISPDEARRGAALLFSAGSLLGLWLAAQAGWLIIAIGLTGLVFAIGYSVRRPGLKYCALGDFSVFVNFGILGSLGGWVVQTGSFSWVPVVWAVPIALLIVGILHANNWRDIESDRQGGFITVAALLGDAGSFRYYQVLVLAPFALVLLGVGLSLAGLLVPPAPLGLLLTAAALPWALKLIGRARDRRSAADPLDFLALDGGTARLNLLFAALAALGLILQV